MLVEEFPFCLVHSMQCVTHLPFFFIEKNQTGCGERAALLDSVSVCLCVCVSVKCLFLRLRLVHLVFGHGMSFFRPLLFFSPAMRPRKRAIFFLTSMHCFEQSFPSASKHLVANAEFFLNPKTSSDLRCFFGPLSETYTQGEMKSNCKLGKRQMGNNGQTRNN